MTPKEKANELIEEYLSLNDNFNKPIVTDEQDAVKCAIVVFDEIIENLHWLEDSINFDKAVTYWQSVKKELEKLK